MSICSSTGRRRNVINDVFGFSTAVLVLAVAASAAEVTVKNDSYQNGGSAMVVGDFVPGEHAGVRFTAPCDGAIVAVQIGWLAGNGGGEVSVERAIHIFEGSTFPTPGSEILELTAPALTEGALNEFRYLDENQTIPISIPVSAGEQFYVTLEFDNPTNVGAGGPSVFRDTDGCQSGKNVLKALPGGWLNFCLYLSGDLVIRAVIDCEEASGACCMPDGSCEDLTQSECVVDGGSYQGDYTECASTDCPQPAMACCFEATNGCLDLTEEDCLLAGGIPGGLGTTCETYVCFPVGACCLPDGSCQDEMSPEDCDAQGGTFMGDGTACESVECPEPSGACCFDSGGCLVLTEANCGVAGGTWAGAGTDCTDGDENGTADACEQTTCAGDTDFSGHVDLTDLATLLSYYGQGGTLGWENGDFDGDGDVDLSDLSALLANYGQDC